MISDEKANYTVIILPTINQDDLNWDAQHAFGSNLGWVNMNPLQSEEQEVEGGGHGRIICR